MLFNRKLFIALTLCIATTVTHAKQVEFYDVKWDLSDSVELYTSGYDPKEISRLMYMANDSCRKRVLGIKERKSKIIVTYRCGIVKHYATIDKYLNKVEISPY